MQRAKREDRAMLVTGLVMILAAVAAVAGILFGATP